MGTAKLQDILQNPLVWRGREHDFHHARSKTGRGLPSGYDSLDARLPDGGWPRGALSEILHAHPGQGELRLLLPTLARLTRQQQYIALVAPPWQPFAPAFEQAGIDLRWLLLITPEQPADRDWALEQTLRSGHCAAVLGWPDDHLPLKTLRRLQLAAEAGNSCGFLLRSSRVREQHSPAALRILLHPPRQLEVIKCRGKYIRGRITLTRPTRNEPATQRILSL